MTIKNVGTGTRRSGAHRIMIKLFLREVINAFDNLMEARAGVEPA